MRNIRTGNRDLAAVRGAGRAGLSELWRSSMGADHDLEVMIDGYPRPPAHDRPDLGVHPRAWQDLEAMPSTARAESTRAESTRADSAGGESAGAGSAGAGSAGAGSAGAGSALAERALAWYDVAARDLPWRHPGTSAWAVLVSEVMLQQTPVARVAPIFVEWLHRWPTPAALAADSVGEAIRAWGRLGYPRRAVRLHACAQVLVERHGGAVPSDLASLLSLPGVGSYTGRAVAAFAYSQRHPVVDTNVRRLVARACTGVADGSTATSARDLGAVEALLPPLPARAARASAALMELGALVCTARTPSCGACPLRTDCAWLRAGRPAPSEPNVRRTQRYIGTDRHVRGLLLAVAREASGGIGRANLDAAWPDRAQRQRALAGLLEDGLLVKIGPDRYGLP